MNSTYTAAASGALVAILVAGLIGVLVLGALVWLAEPTIEPRPAGKPAAVEPDPMAAADTVVIPAVRAEPESAPPQCVSDTVVIPVAEPSMTKYQPRHAAGERR